MKRQKLNTPNIPFLEQISSQLRALLDEIPGPCPAESFSETLTLEQVQSEHRAIVKPFLSVYETHVLYYKTYKDILGWTPELYWNYIRIYFLHYRLKVLPNEFTKENERQLRAALGQDTTTENAERRLCMRAVKIWPFHGTHTFDVDEWRELVLNACWSTAFAQDVETHREIRIHTNIGSKWRNSDDDPEVFPTDMYPPALWWYLELVELIRSDLENPKIEIDLPLLKAQHPTAFAQAKVYIALKWSQLDTIVDMYIPESRRLTTKRPAVVNKHVIVIMEALQAFVEKRGVGKFTD